MYVAERWEPVRPEPAPMGEPASRVVLQVPRELMDGWGVGTWVVRRQLRKRVLQVEKGGRGVGKRVVKEGGLILRRMMEEDFHQERIR